MFKELIDEQGRTIIVNLNNFMWSKHPESGKAVALAAFGQVVFDIPYEDIKELLLPATP